MAADAYPRERAAAVEVVPGERVCPRGRVDNLRACMSSCGRLATRPGPPVSALPQGRVSALAPHVKKPRHHDQQYANLEQDGHRDEPLRRVELKQDDQVDRAHA